MCFLRLIAAISTFILRRYLQIAHKGLQMAVRPIQQVRVDLDNKDTPIPNESLFPIFHLPFHFPSTYKLLNESARKRLHYFLDFNKKKTYFSKDDVDFVIDVSDLSLNQRPASIEFAPSSRPSRQR